MVDGQANVDFAKCMGCGVCTGKCEQEAIQFKLEPVKGKPLDICALQDQQG
jgi:Pyruvate/2-oxoacid:ferredoxin oxidoreductase delta subunit